MNIAASKDSNVYDVRERKQERARWSHTKPRDLHKFSQIYLECEESILKIRIVGTAV